MDSLIKDHSQRFFNPGLRLLLWVGQGKMTPYYEDVYSGPSLQWWHLFPFILMLSWIHCYKEYIF